jgi:hypothetical protein
VPSVLLPERSLRTDTSYLIGYLHKFPERWIVIDSSKTRCGDDTYPYAKQREMQAQHRMLLKISTQEPQSLREKRKVKGDQDKIFFDAAMGIEMIRG